MIILDHISKFKAVYLIVNESFMGSSIENGAALQELPDKS